MAPYYPKSTSKLKSALHFSYLIVIEAAWEFLLSILYFHSTFEKLLLLYILSSIPITVIV